jgi:hypothetical protein
LIKRKAADNKRKQISRENESIDDTIERNANDAAHKRTIRTSNASKTPDTYKLASHTDNVSEIDLGPMNIECTHCKALHFKGQRVSNKGDSFYDCCGHGKVILAPAPNQFANWPVRQRS